MVDSTPHRPSLSVSADAALRPSSRQPSQTQPTSSPRAGRARPQPPSTLAAACSPSTTCSWRHRAHGRRAAGARRALAVRHALRGDAAKMKLNPPSAMAVLIPCGPKAKGPPAPPKVPAGAVPTGGAHGEPSHARGPGDLEVRRLSPVRQGPGLGLRRLRPIRVPRAGARHSHVPALNSLRSLSSIARIACRVHCECNTLCMMCSQPNARGRAARRRSQQSFATRTGRSRSSSLAAWLARRSGLSIPHSPSCLRASWRQGASGAAP